MSLAAECERTILGSGTALSWAERIRSVRLSFPALWGLILICAYKLVNLSGRHSMTDGVPVLIYGAGRRGKSILQELRDNRALCLRPIGFVDDDPSLIGFTRNRVRILGSSRNLAAILNSQKVSAVIISSYKITDEHLISVMSICSKQRIPVLRGEFQLDRVSRVWLSGTRDASDEREQSPTVPEKINAPGHSPVMKVTWE
jgi:FlaA1/EpsC-like NDP-sugar epimerase